MVAAVPIRAPMDNPVPKASRESPGRRVTRALLVPKVPPALLAPRYNPKWGKPPNSGRHGPNAGTLQLPFGFVTCFSLLPRVQPVSLVPKELVGLRVPL